MLKRHPLALAIVLSSLALVACNSNDDDNANLPSKAATTTTITVTPSLGKILNGRVALKNAKTGVILAPIQTLTPTNNGVASFSVPVAKLAEPILAEVLPTTAGVVEYFDEALNQNTSMTGLVAATPVLRAAATVTANSNIGVTALTEAAVQTAEAKAGGLAINIDGVNQLIKAQLKLAHSILQAPLVIGSNADYNKLAQTGIAEYQRVYAAYLANLAKQAAVLNPSSTQPAFDIVKSLAADFKDDSVLNASFNAQNIAIAYSQAFATAWTNVYANLLAALKALPANQTNFESFFNQAAQNLPAAKPIRVIDGVAEYACADEGKLRSSAGSQGMNIDFINQSGSGLKIFWLNYNGGRVSYNANLANTQTHAQGTYVTHPWVVTDSTGECKGIYRPITQTNKMITFKADEVVIGGSNPVVGNQDTCASLGVNPSTLAAIEDFIGSYTLFSSATDTFEVKANGDISLKGQAAQFKEVCKNPTQANGQGYRLITNKATVLLFRSTNNVLSAEGLDFTKASGIFEGNKNVIIDPLKPIRTTNGVEEYSCDSWTKIGNGTADGTPTISFVNNMGANTSLTLFGLNSINKTTTLFTGIANGATRQQTALKNQFVRVETGGGECLGVFKSTTNDDKTISFTTSGVDITNTAAVNTCISQGADNKLGFANAPSDFCSFTKANSTVDAIPNLARDVYTFNGANDEKVTITVGQNTVIGVSIEKGAGKYGFACGAGIDIQCEGIAVTGNDTFKQFTFNNKQLKAITGSQQNLTVTGSLIHQLPIVPPSSTATCVGNTNPYGCLTITGTNAPASIYEYQGNGAPLFQSAVANTGAITFPAKALAGNNLIVNGMVVGYQKIVGSTQNSTYTFFQYDSSFNIIKSISMKCRDANNNCAGLIVNDVDKTVTYDNVVMVDVNGTGAQLTFNGVLKY